MLTTLDLVIYGFLAIAVLPLTLISLMTGSKAPEASFLTKYYRAEPYLNFTGNLFVLTLCAMSISKLAVHFGVLEQSTAERADPIITGLFLTLLLVFMAFWVKAALKVRKLKTGA